MKVHSEGISSWTVSEGRGRFWALRGTLPAVVNVVGHAKPAVEWAVNGVKCLALDRSGFCGKRKGDWFGS